MVFLYALVWTNVVAKGVQALQTTFFDYVWENVFLTIDNLLIPCKISDERKCSLDCERSLPSHQEVKVLSQTLNCTSEVLSIPPETEGPGGRAEPLCF